ncbi:MAG: hypothetical protein MJ252_11965 [archaeon]|nr:hypothetical protein [archaeon]
MDQTFDKIDLGLFAEQKVLAVALMDDFLLFGTEKGLVSCSSIKNGKSIEASNQEQVHSKKPIEKILVNNELKIAYILCNGEILVYPIPSLKIFSTLKIKEDIVKMALNASRKDDNVSILTVSKKKKVRIFCYDPADHTLKEKESREKGKEITLSDSPELIEWYDNILCYKYKKNIYWLQLDNQKLLNSDMEAENINFIRDSIMVSQTEFGILMDLNVVKQFSPIIFPEYAKKNVLGFCEFKNYVLSFHEKVVCFYVLSDNEAQLIQTIYMNNDETGRFILVSGRNTGTTQANASLKLVFVTQSTSGKFRAYEIKEKPFQQVMQKLLLSGKIDDALAKMNDNICSTDENKMDLIEKFFLDSAWVCIKQGNFTNAYKYARLANYDPFEFMYTFYTQLSLNIIHTDCQAKITKDLSKNQIELYIKSSGGGVDNKDKPILKFLMDLLLDKRNYIINKYDLPKDDGKVEKYTSSEMALIDLSASDFHPTILDTLNYINSTLVKVMIKYKELPKEIAAIIDHPSFTCTGICDFNKDEFFSMIATDELKIAMAYFHEKLGRYKQALEIWKNFGQTEKGPKGTIYAKEAKDRTKKIFYKFKVDHLNREQNMKLFEDYLPWLMMKYPEDAFDIVINTEFVTIDLFLSNIVTNVESGMTVKNLKEKFLIFYNKKNPNEKYQTMLMELFIDKLFKMWSNETKFNQSAMTGELKETYDLFMSYLKAKDACYSKNYILDRMKDTWLLDGEIYLYSELKMHDNALEKLIENSISDEKERFVKAEKYCEDNFETKPEIYNMLLEKLIKKYDELRKQGASEPRKQIFENEIISFMQKNKEVEKIDPVKALEMLPENMNVCDERLYEYLTNVIKEYTSLTNKFKIARSISDMALTYKEKELIDEKKKYVMIENETVCDFCKKKIGTTIFVVYPNMKIYHSKCATNPSVCPTTGVDFSKKIMV